ALRRRPPAPQARTETPSPARRRRRGPARKYNLGPGPPTTPEPGADIPCRVDPARGPGGHRGWKPNGPAGSRTWFRERGGKRPTGPPGRRMRRTGNNQSRGWESYGPRRG